MKIAIASKECHLKSFVDPHFGRCEWYCLFDTRTKKNSFLENTVRNQPEKAGCDAAEFLIKKGVEMVVAGRFGSRVIDIFRANNVQMIIPRTKITISGFLSSLKCP
jgi:predicted Fe-Mo cluster-binding NifX family protein